MFSKHLKGLLGNALMFSKVYHFLKLMLLFNSELEQFVEL